ncbi:acyl-CoA N-acyltransferase [Coprinopsis sp. MPI-PUGE-AT-0042]|nr:acyl-CoA N-acyltransferase [Coprinopsis sp. MPI-PUGE-AT-0042]
MNTPPAASVSPAGIRLASPTPADVEAVVALGRAVFSHTFSDNTPEDMEAHLEATYSPKVVLADLKNPQRVVLLAEIEGALAGFAYIARDTREECLVSWPRPVEIQRIYVASAYHGSGIARELAKKTMDWAKEQGYESIWLGVLPTNTRAIRFYQKCGFEKCLLGRSAHGIDCVLSEGITIMQINQRLDSNNPSWGRLGIGTDAAGLD